MDTQQTLPIHCAQSALDAAANAADKGLAQYSTPLDLAAILAKPLNPYRPVLTDLTSAHGNLLTAAANHSTRLLLANDLAPLLGDVDPRVADHFINAPIATLYRTLQPLRNTLDLFTLNPPFGLRWPAEQLPGLEDSPLLGVRDLLRDKPNHLDSSIATLAIALDLGTAASEGYIILNANTARRLLLQPDAPHQTLAAHIWAVLTGPFFPGISVPVSVCYFARGHRAGPQLHLTTDDPACLAGSHGPSVPGSQGPCVPSVGSLIDTLTKNRYHRGGLTLRAINATDPKDIAETWDAARLEIQAQAAAQRSDYHIFLDAEGIIRTQLNRYEKALVAAGTTDTHPLLSASSLATLHKLNGQRPGQLVLQRAQRLELEAATGPDSPWRVQPDLPIAVRAAVQAYHSQRAPLYTLNDIQRLGYLDEHDEIICRTALGFPVSPSPRLSGSSPSPLFVSGGAYSINTQTVHTTKPGRKRNLRGEWEDVEYQGSELVITLRSPQVGDVHFLDATALHPSVKLHDSTFKNFNPDHAFTLADLARCFIIPAVPDLAQRHPDQYAKNLAILDQLQHLLGIRLKDFQREDIARITLVDGANLCWDTGLGKTWAMFLWSLLKVGFHQSPSPRLTDPPSLSGPITPNAPVLIIAPGDLHPQITRTAAEKFRCAVHPLDSQETYQRIAKSWRMLQGSLPGSPSPRLNSPTGPQGLSPFDIPGGTNSVSPHLSPFDLPPGFYITSYTQWSRNGLEEFPPLESLSLAELGLLPTDPAEFHAARRSLFRREYNTLAGYAAADYAADWSAAELKDALREACRDCRNSELSAQYQGCYLTLAPFHGDRRATPFHELPPAQRQAITTLLRQRTYADLKKTLGASRTYGSRVVKSIASPTLADLAHHTFAAVVLDEGTRIQNHETLTAEGIQQLTAPCRMVLTATPIKNRLPSIFNLITWALRITDQPTPRWPFTLHDKKTFIETFQVAETNLTKMKQENSRSRKRFSKYTAQVCNLHRLWKLLAPSVLRRTKPGLSKSGALSIVPQHHHLIHCPLGTAQKEHYEATLVASFPNHGAKLQALRQAAA